MPPKRKHPVHIRNHGTGFGYSQGCRCEKCHEGYREYHRQYRKRDYVKEARLNEHSVYTFGLTSDEVEQIIADQRHRCAICRLLLTGRRRHGKGAYTHIDHSHETGEVRGVLCNRCNNGLGYFNDVPGNLLRAAAYVQNGGAHFKRPPDMLAPPVGGPTRRGK